MGIGWICVIAVLLLPFAFLCVFVNCFVSYIAVVPWGVMIGMSGECWRHKSTLSPIPGSQDWACQSSSLLLFLRLRHFLIFVFSIYFYIITFVYIYLFFFYIFIFKFINNIFI